MFLREAEAKEILEQFGVPIPKGTAVKGADAAEAAARALGATRYAVKALIHAGGRGVAGGVKMAATPSSAGEIAGEMLGTRLVTAQTTREGELVEAVYVEEALRFDESLYLSMLIDPGSALPTILASPAGGVDFEAKAREMPSIVQKFALRADGGYDPAALAVFFENLGIARTHSDALRSVIDALSKAFRETDSNLIEINPLALMEDGRVIAADAKMVLDANALFRHPEFESLGSSKATDPTEMIAQANEINFVKMAGNVGLVVNGAGLGLATLDLVVDAGGNPANFMDIRTTATSFQIAKGIGLLLDDPAVDVLLVNIHGGGMTSCDLISESLSFAYARAERKVPIVFRVAGQNADWALRMMKDRKLPFEPAKSMTEAATRAVAIARNGGRA